MTHRTHLRLLTFSIAASLTMALVSSCGSKAELYCDEETQCVAGYDTCDLQGICCPGPACGHPNTCVPEPCWDAGAMDVDAAITCTANTTTCEDDRFVVCGDDGLAYEVEQCHLGCNDTEVRCNRLVPSNDLAQFLDSARNAPSLVLTDGASIDTDTRTIVNGDASTVVVPTFNVVAPADGVPIMVIQVSAFEAGDVVVSGSAALAIVSDGAIELTGTFEVRARGSVDGPGADNGGSCRGGPGPSGGGIDSGGGGGGGYGEQGAGGGTGSMGLGGASGTVDGVPSIVPLRGGCYGGPSGSGGGGGGGGAVQIVSNGQIRLRPGTFISAGGGGGLAPGGGGGSGGAILLEAASVLVQTEAGLVANGGGGAGACGDANGEDGQDSVLAALGGTCTMGSGGRGGVRLVAPMFGAGSQNGGGGGGAGVGRIRINTRTGLFDADVTAVLSPEPDPGLVTVR